MTESDAPATDHGGEDELPRGWVSIGAEHWRARWSRPTLLLVIAVLVLTADRLVQIFGGQAYWSTAVALYVAIGAGALGLVAAVRNVHTSELAVNLDTNEIRRGARKAVALERVTQAAVPIDPGGELQDTELSLIADKARFRIVLRRPTGIVLDPQSSKVLAEAMTRTNIDYPRSSTDPGGKFSKLNFPGNLEKSEVIEMIRNPPPPGRRSL